MSRFVWTQQMVDDHQRRLGYAPAAVAAPLVTDADRAAAARIDAKGERGIQDDIISFLRSAKNIKLADRPDPTRKSTVTKGRPDILFSYRPTSAPAWMRWGVPVACEVKRPGEMPTKEQINCHADMISDGWYVFIAFNVTDVREALRGIDAILLGVEL